MGNTKETNALYGLFYLRMNSSENNDNENVNSNDNS